MAQQPQIEQNVFPEQGPLPQANGADFGAQIGEAQQGLGGQVSKAGDEAFDLAMKWQGLKNEATAQDANVGFQTELGNLEAKFHSLDGKAASDAYPQFQADVTALRQKYLGAAQNPMVQNMLLQPLAYASSYAMRNGAMYAGQQERQWMQGSAQAAITLNQGLYANGYSDPAHQTLAKNALMASVDNYADLAGLDDNSRALLKQQKLADADDLAEKNRLAFLNGQPVYDVLHAATGQDTGPTIQVGGSSYRNQLINLESPTGGDSADHLHMGYAQASSAWWQQFGAGGDPHNLADVNAALDRETAANLPQLKAALGRPVTNSDLYLAHQQGLHGAINLLTAPADQPAQDSVGYGAVAGNTPGGMANPQWNPANVTAGQFRDFWAQHFQTVDAANTAYTTGIQGGPGFSTIKAAYDGLTDEDKQKLNKQLLDTANSQASAAREQTRFAQEQQAKAEKDQYDAIKTQAQDVMTANWANPGKNPPLDLAQFSQTPYAKAHPEIITDLTNYAKNFNNKPDNDKAVTAMLYRQWLDGTAGADQFQEAYAPKDGTPGSISHDSLDWLMGLTKGKNDPYAETTKGLKAKFLSDTTQHYFGAGGPLSPDSEQRFNVDFETKWADFVAKGKDPRALVSPGNPDYFGTLANLSLYSQTAVDQLKDEQDKNAPSAWDSFVSALERIGGQPPAEAASGAPATPPSTPTPAAAPHAELPAGLPEGSTYAGTSNVDGAPLYRLPKSAGGGLVKAKGQNAPAATPAPAQAPAADTSE